MSKVYLVKISYQGTSKAPVVRIPAPLVKEWGIKVGDRIGIMLNKGRIIIKPINLNLKELMEID